MCRYPSSTRIHGHMRPRHFKMKNLDHTSTPHHNILLVPGESAPVLSTWDLPFILHSSGLYLFEPHYRLGQSKGAAC
jgi:hypothetical protein